MTMPWSALISCVLVSLTIWGQRLRIEINGQPVLRLLQRVPQSPSQALIP
jgi:hypothetical protein